MNDEDKINALNYDGVYLLKESKRNYAKTNREEE